MAVIQIKNPDDTVDVRDVVRPVVYTKKLWSDDWERRDYLHPASVMDCLEPAMPTAQFRFHYGEIKREDKGWWMFPKRQQLLGHYVQVRAAAHGAPERNGAPGLIRLWTGVIPTQTDAIHEGGSGEQGITAYGLSYLLDRVRISTGHVWQNGEVLTIEGCPTFNERHWRGPSVLGNRSTDKQGMSYVFSSEGERWTATEIIEYLMRRHAADGLTWNLIGETDMLDASKGVYGLDGMTVRQALNVLIDRRRGLSWSVEIWEVLGLEWPMVRVHSRFEQDLAQGELQIAANKAKVNVHLNDSEHPERTIDINGAELIKDAGEQYDHIVVRGDPVKSCFTVTHGHGTLEAGWDTADDGLEDAYRVAKGSDASPEDNDRYRQTDKFARVFQSYRLPPDFNWLVGLGAKYPNVEPTYAASPQVIPGTVLTDQVHESWNAYGRLCPRLPLYEGWNYAENPPASENPEGSEPEFMRPFAILYDEDAEKSVLAHNLQSSTQDGSCHVRMSSRELGVVVSARPLAHLLAKDHWEAGYPDPPPHAGSPSNVRPKFDWQYMYVTVCAELDQRPYQEQAVLDGDEFEATRTLTIDVPEAELWLINTGTIVGVDADGEALAYCGHGEIGDGICVLRDDTAVLQSVLLAARAWYGTRRRAVHYTRQRIALEHAPGTMIEAVVTGLRQEQVGTLVERRAWNFDRMTTEIRTGLGTPDFRAFAGRTQVGNLGRQVKRLTHDVDKLRREQDSDRPADPPVPIKRWAKCALPDNRSDDCAWIRPATGDGFVYATPCEPDGSGAADGLTVSQANVEDFIVITFPGAGNGCPKEPNVRKDQVVPYWTSGDNVQSFGRRHYCDSGPCLDESLGQTATFSVSSITPTGTATGPRPGWFWVDDDDTVYAPNTDVSTLGVEVTNLDGRQTVAVHSDLQDGTGWPTAAFPTAKYPYVLGQGGIGWIFDPQGTLSYPTTLKMMGLGLRLAHRLN